MKVTILRRRRNAEAERDIRHIPRARRQRALCSQGAGTQPHHQRLIRHISVPAAENPSPAFAPGQSHEFESRQATYPPEICSTNCRRTLAHGTVARRVETLRRVTDLFINGAVDYSDEQIGLFDDVFQCLIDHIETSAKALLANRLAPIDTAPPLTIRALAFDDVIEVAGPVLSQSMRLDDKTLIENARSKSQAHLMAISTRRVLSGAVTDVLVQRGNDEVVQTTVNNPGAEFTERGFTRLVNRAEGDDNLTTCIGLRPSDAAASLSETAREGIRHGAAAAGGRQPAAGGRGADTRSGRRPGARARRPRRSPRTQQLPMPSSSRCTKTAGSTNCGWRRLPRPAKFDEANASIAALANMPVAIAENMMIESRAEGVMILAKVAGLSWSTVKTIINMRDDLAGGGTDRSRDLQGHLRAVCGPRPRSRCCASIACPLRRTRRWRALASVARAQRISRPNTSAASHPASAPIAVTSAVAIVYQVATNNGESSVQCDA